MQNLLIILSGLIIYWLNTKYEKTWRRRMKIRRILKNRPKTDPELSNMEIYVGGRTGSIYMMDPEGFFTFCVHNTMKK